MKVWYKSKAMWLSISTIVMGAVTAAQQLAVEQGALAIIDPVYTPWILLLVGAGIGIVRVVTTHAIGTDADVDGTPS